MNTGEGFRRVAAVLRTIAIIWPILAFIISINWTGPEEKIVSTLFLFTFLGLAPAGALWPCAWIIDGFGRSE